MTLPRTTLLALALLAPAALAAQRAPQAQTRVNPAALRASAYQGFGVPMLAAAGTQLTPQWRWMGSGCGGKQCLVAQAAAGAAPGLTVQMGDGSVRGARASLLLGHDAPHALRVSLDGSEVMGFSCDGHAVRLQAPGGAGFHWAVYRGQQRVDGGVSTGAPVLVQNPAHAGPGGGPMQLVVQHRDPAQLAGADDAWCKKYGCLQVMVAHGDHRIVAWPALERGTPFPMRTLGLSVEGAPAFAVAGFDVTRAAPGGR